MLILQDKGADGKSNNSDDDESDQEGHDPEISRMPIGIGVSGGSHDAGDDLSDLVLNGSRNLRVSFVVNSFLD